MLFDLRVSIPDRPGTLGALATAMGQGGTNILSLEVVERHGGFAVDDLSVEAPGGMQQALEKATEQVPGLVIEDVRPAEAFRDILAPMELAAKLAEGPAKSAVSTLIEHLPDALGASWAAAVQLRPEGLEVLSISMGAPSLADMKTPWLPLDGPRRLSEATWMPPRWRAVPASETGFAGPEAAAAPLFHSESGILIARRRGPRFRSSELRQLAALGRIAGCRSANSANGEDRKTATG